MVPSATAFFRNKRGDKSTSCASKKVNAFQAKEAERRRPVATVQPTSTSKQVKVKSSAAQAHSTTNLKGGDREKHLLSKTVSKMSDALSGKKSRTTTTAAAAADGELAELFESLEEMLALEDEEEEKKYRGLMKEKSEKGRSQRKGRRQSEFMGMLVGHDEPAME